MPTFYFTFICLFFLFPVAELLPVRCPFQHSRFVLKHSSNWIFNPIHSQGFSDGNIDLYDQLTPTSNNEILSSLLVLSVLALSLTATIFTPTVNISNDTKTYSEDGDRLIFLNDNNDGTAKTVGSINLDTPLHLLIGILCGLNYLLPEKPQQKKLGFERHSINLYETYRNINPMWIPLQLKVPPSEVYQSNVESSPFQSIHFSNVQRIVDLPYSDTEYLGTFRIYKFTLHNELSIELNEKICQLSSDQFAEDSTGISVSNAGGYHSIPNLFNNTFDVTTQRFAEIAKLAVTIAEDNDYQNTNQIITKRKSYKTKLSILENKANKLRTFLPISDTEAWLNVNQHGHWNTLHTHVGASWSGVYYVRSASQFASSSYSGKLLLKPSPHITESKRYTLSDIELRRLNVFDRRRCDANSPTCVTSAGMKLDIPSYSCCDYFEIDPEEGVMIIMPSWLQHAVLPLSIQPDFRGADAGTRISLAFNFVGNE